MERLEYKGCIIEIYTARKEHGWSWAFTIDNGWAQASNEQSFDTAAMAVAAAANQACHVIDKSGTCDSTNSA